MKKLNFSKGFIPCVIASCAIIAFGVVGFFVRGINLGLDFKPGLIEEVRISSPAAELSYNGAAKVAVTLSADKMDIVVSGTGADNATYSYPFYQYSNVGALASAVSEIDGVTMNAKNSSADSTKLFLNSAVSNVLSTAKTYIYPVENSRVTTDDIRAALNGVDGISIKQLGKDADTSFQIRMAASDEGSQNDLQSSVESKLYSKFGKEKVAVVKTDFIGSSFSKSIAGKSVLMFILTVLLIWGYAAIRFHWDFALGSIIALVHDTLIMMTFIIWTQMEFSTTVLAAVLTIIGYSINATVVILDRIRYNLKMMDKVNSFNDILDQSLSDTLTRSILTTVTTLIAVIALFVFTSGSIKDFSLALIVGLVSGAYSSIFISGAFISASRKNWKPEFGVHHSLKTVKADE